MGPLILAVGLMATLASGAAAQIPQTPQTPEVIFNGRDMTGWKAEFSTARVRDGAIHVASSRGWVRTDTAFENFVLRFEMRMGASGGKAGVFVRGWPFFDKDSRPANAYRLTATFDRSDEPSAWQQWEVECIGRTLRVQVDGTQVYSTDTLHNPQGYVGLWGSDGTAEFRSIEIRRLPSTPVGWPGGIVKPGTAGVTMPRLLKEVKPRYTIMAMAHRIEGLVWVYAVVETDGSVGPVTIARSLDPNHGLDDAALAAAQQWRFSPATRDGTPVRTLVTIELGFTLK